ncbi:MAG: type IV secretion system DNA-binding domain-containing protein [Bradyrhizobium sp.]|nr:type IV secretion system DNA-binding domain-containing protein [Bradyrhizobium sp.]
MNNSIRLFRSALLVALGAALITLVAGIISLFVVAPPTVEVLFHGNVSLASDVAIHEILQNLRGERCGHLSWPVVCRLDWIRAIAVQLLDSPIGTNRLATIALGVLAASGFAFFFAYADTPPIEDLTVKRGRRIETGAYANRALRHAIRRVGKPQKNDLWLLPEVQLNAASTTRNLLLVGTQGSGKTGLLRAFADQYLNSLSGRMFVLDAKGDMLAGLPVDSMILVAPQDARGWAIDIGREITNPLIAREFATKCVPVSEQDPMWAHGTRSVLTDIIMALHARSGEAWGWGDLADAALSSAADIRRLLLQGGGKSAALLNFGDDPEENRTVMSILITIWVTVLSVIEPLARVWSEVDPSQRFTVRDWLAPGSRLPRTLLLQKSGDYPELSSTVGSFLAERVAAAALASTRRRPGTEGLTMLLDEFPEVPIERLPRLLALGRELHVNTIATVQDLGQITALFGQEQGSVVESRFGIRLVLRLEPGETARRICEVWVGRRQIRRRRDTTVEELARGIARPMETVWEDTITPDILSDTLGVFETSAGKMIRVLVTGFPTLAIVDVPITTWADRREAHVPAPWLAGPWMHGRQRAEQA